jgi:5'-3' exonuclease
MLGTQWVLHYYQQGTKAVSSRYIYPHHHAPLLKDLGIMMEYLWKHNKAPSVETIKFSALDPKITPIHQLIAVMPPLSWKFIPEPFRSLMLTRFADLSPMDFKIEKEGIMKGQEWTAIPLLSIVDPIRISRDLEDYDIPKEYRDRLPYFVKNVKRVLVPQKPQTLEDVRKMEERRQKREAELFQAKPTPSDPLTGMKERIIAIEQKLESKKFEVEDKTFRKRNVFVWKRDPLM